MLKGSDLMSKIPKIIHYCWFGGNPLSESILHYISTWKEYCPEYEIKQWDETNFDVTSNIYVNEAYNSQQWAFVTDYVRLYVLYNYGGIYMDTDVELLENIDNFLIHSAFTGFEDETRILTAIMGAEKKNIWIEYLLQYYDNKHFIGEDGSIDKTTNVTTITNMTKEKYNIKLDNTYQVLSGGLVIYPNEYFSPKNYKNGQIKLTKKTYCIHHFNGSWHSTKEKKEYFDAMRVRKILGDKLGNYYVSSKLVIKNEGIGGLIKRVSSEFNKASKDLYNSNHYKK